MTNESAAPTPVWHRPPPKFVATAVFVVRATYLNWRSDRTLRLGAGLAYYSLFAVVPLLALTAALAEMVFGAADMSEYFAQVLRQAGLIEADEASQLVTDELTRQSVQTSLGLIGLGSLLFAASLFFLALVDAVNVIWGVPVRTGVWNSVRRRLISFLMVLVTGGVLIAGVAVTAVAGVAEVLLPRSTNLFETFSPLIARLAPSVALVVALAMLFRFLGPVRVPWRPALFAASVTALLGVVGALATGWYFRTFGGSSVSGAFGALLAALSFVYFESQILLGGVQFVKVITQPNDGSAEADGNG